MKNLENIKISIFGLGFVGLTTAVGFAQKGLKVYGYEIDPQKAQLLREGKIPFHEEGLSKAMQNVLDKFFFVTYNTHEALQDSDIIFYCIGTPMDDDGSADLGYLLQAIESTCKNITLCSKQPILIIKSTIPPSSCEEVFIPFIRGLGLNVNCEKKSDVFLLNNPEFLREGTAYQDFMQPDRIVIGSPNAEKFDIVQTIYEPFYAPIFFTSLNTAEFIKYLSNTMLATNISFANEMSMIAQTIGDIDIKKSFEILHQDKRFYGNPSGISTYVYPGLGFGGYCLPKDTLALSKKAKDKGFETKILNSVLQTNEDIINFYVEKIKKEIPPTAKLCILGLSFKPNSDDVRDSKSATFIKKLLSEGYNNIIAYDPIANDIFAQTYNFPILYAKKLDEAIHGADLTIICTGWDDFKEIDHSKKKLNLRFI